MKVGILTPGFAPAPGGAANYTRMLAVHLARDTRTRRVEVYTEQYPGEQKLFSGLDGKLVIHRLFGYRAGRDVRDWRSYLDYARQNLSFLRMHDWLATDLDVLLIHSQLHYNPTLLDAGLRRLRRARGAGLRLVMDVRDPLMPVSKKSSTELYDDIICCSLNTLGHMNEKVGTSRPTHLVPVPLEEVHMEDDEIKTALEKYGLAGRQFLLATNGMQRSKGIDLCLAVTRILRRQMPGLALVVAGRRRDWAPEYEAALAEGVLIYLGMIPNRELMAIAAGSTLHINPSPIEGLPRASLEALAVGAPVLLPPNVPEFEEYCPGLVARSADLDVLARQITAIIGQTDPKESYPVDRHYIGNVLEDYLELFAGRRRPD